MWRAMRVTGLRPRAEAEFSKSAAEKKETEEALSSLAASLEEMSATVETLGSEISTLQDEIKVLGTIDCIGGELVGNGTRVFPRRSCDESDLSSGLGVWTLSAPASPRQAGGLCLRRVFSSFCEALDKAVAEVRASRCAVVRRAES